MQDFLNSIPGPQKYWLLKITAELLVLLFNNILITVMNKILQNHQGTETLCPLLKCI